MVVNLSDFCFMPLANGSLPKHGKLCYSDGLRNIVLLKEKDYETMFSPRVLALEGLNKTRQNKILNVL